MAIVVTGLALTPVKATQLRAVDRIRLRPEGVRENRRFFLIDDRGRMVNSKNLGALEQVIADYDDAARRLRMTFPGGRVLAQDVLLGEEIETEFYSEPLAARLVDGPWAEALSELTGKPLRVVEAPDEHGAVDRRDAAGTVSLISRASLARLAEVGGQESVDSRRFRMLIEIDGVPSHAEDDWVGRQVQIGEASVSITGNVGRCLITSRHPESGEVDLPTLDILRSYRTDFTTTEPLPFGVWGRVLSGGTVALGDSVVAGDRVGSR
jgi:MOSC domain-containing protein